MARLEKEILVRRPREEVYDFLLDIETRRAFYPEAASDFRITSANVFGVGATQSFGLRLGRTYPGETVISGVLPPEGVTEVGRWGPARITLRYGLEDRDDDTLVRLILEYDLSGLVQSLLAPVLGAPAVARWHAEVVEKLREAIESESTAQTRARAARSARNRSVA